MALSFRVEGFFTSWLWKLVAWLPGFILRLVFTSKRLLTLIQIDLRPRHDPVTLNFGEIPYAQVFLQVTNRSPFTVELDRLRIELFYGSGSANLFYLDRTQLKSGTTTDIYIQGELSDGYATSGSRIKDEARCEIEIRAEFNSRIASFSVRTGRLEGIRPRIVNARKL